MLQTQLLVLKLAIKIILKAIFVLLTFLALFLAPKLSFFSHKTSLIRINPAFHAYLVAKLSDKVALEALIRYLWQCPSPLSPPKKN